MLLLSLEAVCASDSKFIEHVDVFDDNFLEHRYVDLIEYRSSVSFTVKLRSLSCSCGYVARAELRVDFCGFCVITLAPSDSMLSQPAQFLCD